MDRRLEITIALSIIVPTLILLSYFSAGYSVRIITGDSMGSSYDDVVVVDTSVTWDDVSDGDVISFRNECGYTTHHRLVYDTNNNKWRTLGDKSGMYDIGDCYQNPIEPDSFEEKIIGKKVKGINLPFF